MPEKWFERDKNLTAEMPPIPSFFGMEESRCERSEHILSSELHQERAKIVSVLAGRDGVAKEKWPFNKPAKAGLLQQVKNYC